jgi:microcystin degradation protein MlrC
VEQTWRDVSAKVRQLVAKSCVMRGSNCRAMQKPVTACSAAGTCGSIPLSLGGCSGFDSQRNGCIEVAPRVGWFRFPPAPLSL